MSYVLTGESLMYASGRGRWLRRCCRLYGPSLKPVKAIKLFKLFGRSPLHADDYTTDARATLWFHRLGKAGPVRPATMALSQPFNALSDRSTACGGTVAANNSPRRSDQDWEARRLKALARVCPVWRIPSLSIDFVRSFTPKAEQGSRLRQRNASPSATSLKTGDC